MMGKLAMRAQLPMKPQRPQDIITAVWYGIHAINLYYQDQANKQMTIDIYGRKIPENRECILEAHIRHDKTTINKTITAQIITNEVTLAGKIRVDVEINGARVSFFFCIF